MKPERAREISLQFDEWLQSDVQRAILQACAEQREEIAQVVHDWPMPTNGRLALEIAAAIRRQD